MKTLKLRKFTGVALIALVAASLTACGSSRRTNSTIAATGTGVGGGCMNISQPLTFQGQQAIANDYEIIAGRIPGVTGMTSTQSNGVTPLTVGTGTVQQQGMTPPLQKYSQEGSLTMWVSAFSNQQNGFYNINGTFQIGSIIQQLLLQQYNGSAYGFNQWPNSGYNPNGYPGSFNNGNFPNQNQYQQLCVSELGIYAKTFGGFSSRQIYEAYVFVYLNNQQNGFWLYL